MKKIIAMLLILCLCIGLCACGGNTTSEQSDSTTTTTTTTVTTTTIPDIITGLTISALKNFASSSGVEQYNETDAVNSIKEFTFESTFASWKGEMSGTNVVSFTQSYENVTADTSDEFLAWGYLAMTNPGQLTYNQLIAAVGVLALGDTCKLLGKSDVPLGTLVDTIMNNSSLSIDNWTISVELNRDLNTLVIHTNYNS